MTETHDNFLEARTHRVCQTEETRGRGPRFGERVLRDGERGGGASLEGRVEKTFEHFFASMLHS